MQCCSQADRSGHGRPVNAAHQRHPLRCRLRPEHHPRRPLLHHLNADTSWLIQLPRPASAVRHGGRHYYNILIDPWFKGTQTDFIKWFSRQWHAEASAVASVTQVEDLAQRVEGVARGSATAVRYGDGKNDESGPSQAALIDVVLISHEFTDHCHRETLLELHPDTPVFANKEAVTMIESWRHFRTVVPIDNFGAHSEADWRGTSIPPLPAWIGIGRLLQKSDLGALHSAMIISFKNRQGAATSERLRGARVPVHRHDSPNDPIPTDNDTAEAIIYTPHGIAATDVALLPTAAPPIRTLALLHGLHNVRVGSPHINLGGANGRAVQAVLRAKYWIGTHDEVKQGVGLVGWLLRRDDVGYGGSAGERNQAEQAMAGKANKQLSGAWGDLEGANWVELRNGESKVLE
ncbi:hypothetical protein LTR53_005992 [Teratosphaeriaceae sp. CCFEE 6253]|nr:hypothetical protein LTR53_005992 [Teratosphaeriaceae sp. CCFEE 6253]